VALGIDVTDSGGSEIAGFLEAGLHADLSTVMTAATWPDPPHPNRVAQYRPLQDDDDWLQSLDLQVAANADEEAGAERAFCERRTADARRLAGTGRGAWFGAFHDGRLVAQLGLVSDGAEVARYQNVETHPAARRQGLAGTLVCQAGRYGIEELAASTLVIVAEAGSAAARLYQSVGFASVEDQVGFAGPAGETAAQIR
jgi:ribosomal protein S18 acetylase RimI-like enzyme